ncbi:polyketide synthase dehydratase domain-containing protein [Streptomyces sp. NBC_00091]|nr:polyketide synthase dehydratase domain-containing protein [Streptomyces sp. NBC_00091]
MLTGRLRAQALPWLTDHRVSGVALLPGTACADLALRAGERCGHPAVEELTLQAPLVLHEGEEPRIQVRVGPPGPTGRREFRVHSRTDGGARISTDESGWTRHAAGTPTATAPTAPTALPITGAETAAWPPAGETTVDITDGCARMADLGYGYGPAFRGVTSVWRRGDEIFAELRLPEQLVQEAARFGLHPALLDAGLQVHLLGEGADQRRATPRGVHHRVRLDQRAAHPHTPDASLVDHDLTDGQTVVEPDTVLPLQGAAVGHKPNGEDRGSPIASVKGTGRPQRGSTAAALQL